MHDSEDRLTVENFEYAVRLDTVLVSLFRREDDQWRFIRTANRWDAITMATLENNCFGSELYVFPFGFLPDQIWEVLHRLEVKESGVK